MFLLSKNLRSTILCISVLSVCNISHAKAQSFAKFAWSACGGLTRNPRKTQNAVRSGIVSRRRLRLSQNNMRSKVSVVFRDFRVDLHQRISVPSLWRVPRRWSGRYRCGCRSRNWRRWWHIPFEGRTWRCRNSRR